MKERINVAELLKDCPKGMELDCMMYENVELDFIEQNPESIYPIHCLLKLNGGCNALVFTHDGRSDRHPNAKCVIFPKGKTTWEGFQRPFKDGDIVATQNGIWIGIHKRMVGNAHEVYLAINHDFLIYNDNIFCFERLATEEEKQKLFKAIKDNGYKWNSETKTLKKLVEPKFKVGNVIQDEDGYKVKITEVNIEDERYGYESIITKVIANIVFSKQDNWELVPNKFDINTLVPFESKVLVRDSATGIWYPEFFGCLCDSNDCPYMVLGGNRWKYCVPYKGNEHLLKTNNDCDDYYKTWE